MGFRKGNAFSIPSMFASDCTNAMGIMKKKVRKKKATAIISLLIVSETYGIAKLSQNTSRGSGAHSVNHIVGFLVCWVCAQTAAPHRVLKETNAAGMICLVLFIIFSFSEAIWKLFIKKIVLQTCFFSTQLNHATRMVKGTHLNRKTFLK